MIITDKFVFLHYPKTGGTFVTQVLERVHEKIQKKTFGRKPVFKNLEMPSVKWTNNPNQEVQLNQHGSYEQIPNEDKNKPIISIIRNPFDRYVSLYEFRRWTINPNFNFEIIKEHFPTFPELSFEEYLKFINTLVLQRRADYQELKLDIGIQTYSFIQMFFNNPTVIIKNLDKSYVNSDAYKNDLPKIAFLRMENLNQDLYTVLFELGYAKKDISFILGSKKVLPVGSTRHDNQKWEHYYNKEMYEHIRYKERFLLKIFPEYNLDLF